MVSSLFHISIRAIYIFNKWCLKFVVRQILFSFCSVRVGNLCSQALDCLMSRCPHPAANKWKYWFLTSFYRFETNTWQKDLKTVSLCTTPDNMPCDCQEIIIASLYCYFQIFVRWIIVNLWSFAFCTVPENHWCILSNYNKLSIVKGARYKCW